MGLSGDDYIYVIKTANDSFLASAFKSGVFILAAGIVAERVVRRMDRGR